MLETFYVSNKSVVKKNDFKYLVDQFADIRIMRYRIPDWENLTLQQKEVKVRYDAIGLKPYGGFISPENVPVVEDGKVVDYRPYYPSDFLVQHLEYGKKYAFLEVFQPSDYLYI